MTAALYCMLVGVCVAVAAIVAHRFRLLHKDLAEGLLVAASGVGLAGSVVAIVEILGPIPALLLLVVGFFAILVCWRLDS